MINFKSLAASILILPITGRGCPLPGGPSDTQIFNFALTLEHLENAFYTSGLAKYDQAAFSKAGFQPWVRNRFTEVASHEAQHVSLLQGALGGQAVQPCKYHFPYTDVKSFVGLAMVLENLGVSAYVGAANGLTDPKYVKTAAAILATEARHSAWISSAVRKEVPWMGALASGLGYNHVYSIAAGFMSDCPTTSSTLSVNAFPKLHIESCSYKPGSKMKINWDGASSDVQHYVAFYADLDPVFASVDKDKQCDVPSNLTGLVYAVLTTAQDVVTDQNTVAGPALMFFPTGAE